MIYKNTKKKRQLLLSFKDKIADISSCCPISRIKIKEIINFNYYTII